MIKIEKFFSNHNICTRSQFKKFMKNNTVKVNGQRIEKSCKIVENDIISVNDSDYKYMEKVYIVMNKPKGYVCANIDNINPTVFQLLDSFVAQNDLFTVGRLDKDTTGLLIITNDGAFAHSIINDKKNFPKKYLVKCKFSLSKRDIDKLEEGVIILDDYLTQKASVKVIEDDLIELTICEGKYHQVKEMLKAVDNQVINLKRVAIGNLKLKTSLKTGEYKLLSAKDMHNKIELKHIEKR